MEGLKGKGKGAFLSSKNDDWNFLSRGRKLGKLRCVFNRKLGDIKLTDKQIEEIHKIINA